MDLKSWKNEFQRQTQDPNSAVVIAKRLINLYRQVLTFGEDEANRFNYVLKTEVTPEVLMELHALPNGDEVRNYYNYLTEKQNSDEEQDSGDSVDKEKLLLKNYLPKSEELSPLWQTFGMPATKASSVQTTGNQKKNVMALLSAGSNEIEDIMQAENFPSDAKSAISSILNRMQKDADAAFGNNKALSEVQEIKRKNSAFTGKYKKSQKFSVQLVDTNTES